MSDIEQAIATIGRGEMVVVVDDADRENEGDLVMAAEFATPEKVAFFLAHTSGLICVPLTADRADELELPLMVAHNTESQRTAFTVTVDYRYGTTTGISAGDRAATIRSLIDPDTKPADLARPGHVLPLRYRAGGVLKRAGHTEATVDLARMAGCYPAGLLCEIVTEDKQRMARQPELERFAAEHGLRIISIADLVRYRRHREKLVERVAPRASRPSSASSSPTASGPSSTAKSTSLWWRETFPQKKASSCGCTANASPVTCSAHFDATAVPNSKPPSDGSEPRASASSCTCAATRDVASASPTSCGPTTCRTTAGTPLMPTSSSGFP